MEYFILHVAADTVLNISRFQYLRVAKVKRGPGKGRTRTIWVNDPLASKPLTVFKNR